MQNIFETGEEGDFWWKTRTVAGSETERPGAAIVQKLWGGVGWGWVGCYKVELGSEKVFLFLKKF